MKDKRTLVLMVTAACPNSKPTEMCYDEWMDDDKDYIMVSEKLDVEFTMLPEEDVAERLALARPEREHYWDECEKLLTRNKSLKREIDELQAVVDAALLFCHHDIAAHHGPNEYNRKKSRKNLFDEVAAYEEQSND